MKAQSKRLEHNKYSKTLSNMLYSKTLSNMLLNFCAADCWVVYISISNHYYSVTCVKLHQ